MEPSGCEMKAGLAERLNAVPLTPGVVAWAADDNSARAVTINENTREIEIAVFLVIEVIAALLLDPNFRHQPAEVLGVIREVIEIAGVEIKHLTGLVFPCVASIQNDVERLA